MNARIPSELYQQGQLDQALNGCTAVSLFFLETSGKYFDLNVDSLKKQVDSFFRAGAMPQGQGAESYAVGCEQFITETARETGRMVRDGAALSLQCQAEWLELLKANSQLAQQAIDASVKLWQQGPTRFGHEWKDLLSVMK